jgi:hypothetical protein
VAAVRAEILGRVELFVYIDAESFFTCYCDIYYVIKIEIKMRNERHGFLCGNPYGKNHGRTKAYFHYDGGVLQARDDRPSLVQLLGYIYEGNIQESLEDKKNEIYSYAPASVHKAH